MHRTETPGTKRIWTAGLVCLLLSAAGACVSDSARDSFKSSMDHGDLGQAAAAMGRMESSGEDVEGLREQFACAKANAALLARGYQQIEDEDFEGVRQTWKALNDAAAAWKAHLAPGGKGRKSAPWSAGYLKSFEGDIAKLKEAWDDAEREYAARTAAEAKRAAAKHRGKEAESKIRELRELGYDVTALEQNLLFERQLAGGSFEDAASTLRTLSKSGEATEDLRLRLRDGIREALEKDWKAEDYRAVAEKCRLLNRIGDNTEDIASRLLEVYLAVQDVYLRGMSVRLDGPTSPDFTVEKKNLVEFAEWWKEIFETIDDGRRAKDGPDRVALLERLQRFWTVFPEKTFLKRDFWQELDDLSKQAKGLPKYWERYISRVCQLITDLLNFHRKWYLYEEGKATLGLMPDGRMQYWVRCAPANFLDDEHLEYQCDMLKVHLCGYVKEVQRGVGEGSIYWVEGFDGGRLEVDTDYAAPGVGDLVYVLGTTAMQKGRVHHIQEYESHLPLMDLAGVPPEDAAPTLYDVRYWMNFEYDFMLENMFRRFACQRLGKRLPALTYGEWDAGRRTTVKEVEDFFFHPGRKTARKGAGAGE